MVINMANIMGIGTVSRTQHLVNRCGVIRAVMNISTDNSTIISLVKRLVI